MNLPALNKESLGQKYESSQAFGFIFPVFGIIASLLIAALVIWPKVNEIIDLRKTNEELAGRTKILEQKAQVLASVDEGKLEDQLISAEQLIPSDKNTFSFLRQVEGSSIISGVLLNKIDVDVGSLNAGQANAKAGATKVKSVAGASSVAISLSAQSDYQSLLQFLNNLYSFSRVVSIDSLSISSSQQDGSQLRINFSVNGYWKQLPSTLGSIESPVIVLTTEEARILEDVTAPEVIQTSDLPQVPIGRGNLFTPF